MSIQIVIPASGRHELTRRVVLYYQDLGYDPVVVIDDEDWDEYPDEFATFSMKASIPLGAKFNEAIAYPENREYKGVVLVGSDDLISPEYLKSLEDTREEYVEIKGCHFFNSATGDMLFIKQYYCGAGKYFGREFLSSVNYRPYNDRDTVNVDSAPKKKAYAEGFGRAFRESLDNMPLCIDIKTDENMTVWERIAWDPKSFAVDPYVNFHRMNNEHPDYWRGL